MCHAARELADRFHLLGLPQGLLRLAALRNLACDALLQRLVQCRQQGLGLAPLFELAGVLLEQSRIVHGDGGLAGQTDHPVLRKFAEHTHVGVSEEQSTQHLAGPRAHRHGQIAADRQMSCRHAMIGRRLAVARILRDVVGEDDRGTAERRLEDRGVARHRELRKGLACHTGQRIERVALPALVDHVVEERAELCARHGHAGVGDRLHQALVIEIARDRR